MASQPVSCPHCHGHEGVKHSRTAEGKQRYKCCHPDCPCTTFIRSYSSRGYLPEVKPQIADRTVNGRGIRDTAWVL